MSTTPEKIGESKLEQDRINTIERSAGSFLDAAFQYFFGHDGTEQDINTALDLINQVGNLEIGQEALIKAPSVALARAMISMQVQRIDEFPFRFFLRGRDFQNILENLPAETAGLCMFAWSRCFSASVIGRKAILIVPQLEHCDARRLLERCAAANPNVIGPFGITCNVQMGNGEILPFALLFAPFEEKAVRKKRFLKHSQNEVIDLLNLALGVADGLSHLHRNRIVHGDVSVDHMRIGLNVAKIVTGAGFKRVRAPECFISSDKFSTASDVFQFGHALIELITGGSWENNWSKYEENDSDRRRTFYKYLKAVKNDYAVIKDHIPKWCPDALSQIILKCLNYTPSKRPRIEIIATELRKFKQSFIPVLEKPKIWINLSNVCIDLIAEEEELRPGGIYEHLYTNKVQAEILKKYDPKSRKSKILSEKLPDTIIPIRDKIQPIPKGLAVELLNSKLAKRTRAKLEYTLHHFCNDPLFNWNSITIPPFYGIRHLPSFALGTVLYSDEELDDYTQNNPKKLLKKPPRLGELQMWCGGESEQCRCDRESRPKQAKVLIGLPDALMRQILPYLHPKEYNAFALTSKLNAKQFMSWRVMSNSDSTYRDKIAVFMLVLDSGQLKRKAEVKKVREAKEAKETDETQKIVQKKRTILEYAMEQQWGLVRSLLKKGCKELDAAIPGSGTESGFTALHLALRDGQFKTAFDLVQNGADFGQALERFSITLPNRRLQTFFK